MEFELKKRALEQLVRTEGPTVEQALEKESRRIKKALESETLFDTLKDQLDFLAVISFRLAAETVLVLKGFLTRIESLETTHKDVMGMSAERIQIYQTKESLIVKALEILGQIRYHEPDAIFALLLKYSNNDNDEISNKAIDELESLAEFNIDVFYAKDDWQGLGTYPQQRVIENTKKLSVRDQKIYFFALLKLCEKILSPTMQSTSSDYKTFTWTTSAVPGIEPIIQVRNDALAILFDLYELGDAVPNRIGVVNATYNVSLLPNNAQYGDDTVTMIDENTLSVLEFWKSVLKTAELEVLQKIEHHSYWIHRRKSEGPVRAATIEIKNELDGNNEYQIYKALIGYEGVFAEWQKDVGQESDEDFHREIKSEDEYRDAKAREFALSIDDENYKEWTNRIVRYATVQSDDLATFPVFGKFLEYLGELSPTTALRMVTDESNALERFFAAIFCGIWKTDKREPAEELLQTWISEGKFLYVIARIFEYNSDPENPIVSQIFKKATETEDSAAVVRIMAVVAANYTAERKHLVSDLFVPAVSWLTEREEFRWVFDFWYRKQIRELVRGMASQGHAVILENLLNMPDIDYHAEEILLPIAESEPQMVLKFFVSRIDHRKNKKEFDRYSAVPFSFQKLAEPLSRHPDLAVDELYSTYDDNYGMFVFEGGKLLKIIFPHFSSELEKKLIEFVSTGKERRIRFCMAILRNYEGESFLHNICKELVKVLPTDSRLLTEVEIILESTGVVWGEFGIANAYMRKREEVSGWTNDSNEKVRQFAKRYTSNLEKMEDAERKRAAEDIELRKLKYGSNDEE
ncbi:hypothetical protein [Woeseia oceani]|uniref:Uncharacterized protein n=1 Tax=Woeseia oceani TaxID=1548547 RepID=A0A193LCA7_9GAMM|nr:hypothetical protein [Woeseia oceani]ANO50066.1 hypothetical protein BA177_01465 [Woeseia oceani]